MVLWILVILALLLSLVNLFLNIKNRNAIVKIVGPSIDQVKGDLTTLIKKLKKVL